MEWFLSLFIFHDAYVVSFLVLAIAILVVLLLIFNHKSPQSVVDSELGNPRGVEEALRRVLEDNSIVRVGADNGVDNQGFEKLKEEVLHKDRTIAELNKKLTQSSSAGGIAVGMAEDTDELKRKIADLEDQLQEYELIEDDIADLSSYRAENSKLKAALAQLKSQLGDNAGLQSTPSPDADSETVASEEEKAPSTEVESPDAEEDPLESILQGAASKGANASSSTEDSDKVEQAQQMESSEETETSQQMESLDDPQEGSDSVSSDESKAHNGKVENAPAEDLLSAFEKVVSQQESMPGANGQGDTSVVDTSPQSTDSPSRHPKLKDLKPDSKEEADVFINELKSLRKGS